MKNEMKVLVTGATGAQGGAVVKLLHEQGIQVRALLLAHEDATPFEAKGISVVRADFADAASLKNALQGVNAVSLVFPLIYDWPLLRRYTANWLEALVSVPVERVVFNTSLALPPAKTGAMAADIKLEIFEAFVAAQLPLVTLTPSFYLDNLSAPWSLPVIQQHGVVAYPLPGHAPFAWLSHVNLARFTYAALTRDGLVGRVIPVGGALITGEEIALKFGAKLGREVQYVHQSPEQFKQILLQQFDDSIASEISGLYDALSKHPEPFKAFYQPALAAELGVTLQTTDEWLDAIAWN